MLVNGTPDKDATRTWLASIKCEELTSNFVDNGYDLSTIVRMTPQDLTAIGCKSPACRKKLLIEIKKLNIEDDIPHKRPDSLEAWLHLLKLIEYYPRLCVEGYDTIDKVCDLTWEDLEDAGIVKLGHQKRLLLGIEKLKKAAKIQEEEQCEYSIYDCHPNHRISLNKNISPEARFSTLSRSTSRSGFFQTRSGATLDHRGLPVATVMPALKHINAFAHSLDDSTKLNQDSVRINNRLSTDCIYGTASMRHNPRSLNDFCTIKRSGPPLPPLRTNSLKVPTNDMFANVNNNDKIMNNNNATSNNDNNTNENDSRANNMNNTNSIYGTYKPTGGTFTSSNLASSTSFLRKPRIGTLTATTNKMLTSGGGHLRAISGSQTLMRSNSTKCEINSNGIYGVPEKIDEESCLQLHSFANGNSSVNGSQSLISSSSLISHQLAGPEEFPPPPPSQ